MIEKVFLRTSWAKNVEQERPSFLPLQANDLSNSRIFFITKLI